MKALHLAVLAGLIAGPTLAQPRIDGMWYIDQSATRRSKAVYTPETLAKREAAAKRIADGAAKGQARFMKSEAHTKCLPTGMPLMMAEPFGLNILQGPGRVVMLNEVSTLPRVVYLDQAKQPEVDLTWNGHSIGHWEGATLVVDTIGINGRAALVSPQTHLTERFTLSPDGKALINELTQEDPTIYAEPYKATFRYDRQPDSQETIEYVCEIDPADVAAYEKEHPTVKVKRPGGAD